VRLVRRSVAGLLAGLLLLGVYGTVVSSPAGAHALLADSTPADGASVDQAPGEVRLEFTEAVDPSLTVVHVLDSSGARVEAGKAEVPGAPTVAYVSLHPLSQGTYTVTWRTTSSADGHTTVGSFAFGVGVSVAAVGSKTTTGATFPTVASMAGRWLFYVGLVLLLGAAVVGALVVARPRSISLWALNAAWAAAAIGLVITIADQRATTHTSVSGLLASATGHKLKAEAIAVVITWLAICWATLRPSRTSLVAVGAGASGVMLEHALSGHADATTARWFTVPVQWLHLVAVGAWVGGFVWLLIALRRHDPGRGPGLARQFSKIAAAMLGVVVVSGTLRAVDEVGAWSGLVHTTFGRALLVKLGIVAVLVAVGARNRFRHVAAAAASRVAGLRRMVRAEVVLAAGVLGATAVLAGLPPSATLAAAAKRQKPPSLTVTGSDYATSVRLQLVVSPGSVGPNRFDATVVDYDSRRPVAAQSVTLQLQLKDRTDIGPATVELTRQPDSHWRATSSSLSIDGRWTVTGMVQTATDSVDVPMELVVGRRGGGAG
jgi:copper transport protein